MHRALVLLCLLFQQEKKLQKAQKKREGGPKQTPHTIESLREKDETIITDITTEENNLVRTDLENDEFSDYYKSSYEPKVLITYSDNPLRVCYNFLQF